MESTLQSSAQMRLAANYLSFEKSIGWGILGGLICTLVMDLLLIGAFTAARMPPFTCFSLVGDTVASLFSHLGMQLTGDHHFIGIAAHYLIGPMVGAIFAGAVTKIHALRIKTRGKGIIFAILFVELLSQPLLALMPILLRTDVTTNLMWYGGSLVMHFIWGSLFGVLMGRLLHWPLSAD